MEQRLSPDIFKIHLPKDEVGYIYLVKTLGYIKIGITRDPKKRIDSIRNSLPVELSVIKVLPVKDYRVTERELHNKYIHKHVKNEWFTLDDNDVNDILSNFV